MRHGCGLIFFGWDGERIFEFSVLLLRTIQFMGIRCDERDGGDGKSHLKLVHCFDFFKAFTYIVLVKIHTDIG